MRIAQFGLGVSTFGKNYPRLFVKVETQSNGYTGAMCKTGEEMSVDEGLRYNYFSTFKLEFV